MPRKFERSDEGMRVRTTDGDDVGTIETVEGDTARVKPDSNLSESVRKRLGWSSEHQEAYELPHSKVKEIDDDAVHIED